jgi:ABC-2 type transport system permease protein
VIPPGIGAILYAQWLSLRRGTPGEWSAVLLTVLPAALWCGLWTSLAFAVHLAARELEPTDLIAKAVSSGFLLCMSYWQLSPVLSASLGSSLDLRKLRVYPVSDGRLFTLDVLLRFATGAEVLLILVGGGTGLVRNATAGGRAAGVRIAAASAIFVLLNLLLGAGVRSIIDRIMARKRIREAAVFLIAILAVLPQFLIATRAISLRRVERFLDFSTGVWWPWEAAARLVMNDRAPGALAALLAWTAAAFAFGRWAFLLHLRQDSQPSATDVPSSWERPVDWFCRLPGLFLRDPAAAIAEKELRVLIRTPRFRLAFVMGFTFGLLVWLPTALGREETSVTARNLPVFVSIYALLMLGHASYWNAFGFDRSAAQGWIVWPVSIRKTLLGKNLAAAAFVLLETIAVMIACVAAQRRIPLEKIAEAIAVTPVVALYLFAAGNLTSVHFPRGMNPERMGGRSPGRAQGLLLLLFPLMLFPVLLAYWAGSVFESVAVFAGMLALAAAIGAVVYWIAMDSAVERFESAREEIVAELSRGAGPVERD